MKENKRSKGAASLLFVSMCVCETALCSTGGEYEQGEVCVHMCACLTCTFLCFNGIWNMQRQKNMATE